MDGNPDQCMVYGLTERTLSTARTVTTSQQTQDIDPMLKQC